jgi:hypothetical protein
MKWKDRKNRMEKWEDKRKKKKKNNKKKKQKKMGSRCVYSRA